MTSGESPQPEEEICGRDSCLNWNVCVKSPLCDRSGPVDAHWLVPCYSSSATLSAMRLLSFVLIKRKTQIRKTCQGAHSHYLHAGVRIRRWAQGDQRAGRGPLDIKVWTVVCKLVRLCPLLSEQQLHRPVQAGVNWDSWFSLIPLTHTGALLARHMADVRDSFTVFLPVLHVLPDVSVRKGSVLIEEFPILPSEACCVVLQLLLGGGRSVLQVA